MLNTSIPSLTSTPYNSNKENECPNPNFTCLLSKKSNKKEESSLRTDPQFNMFKTINVQRQGYSSSSGHVGTKSRADMEAILENISTKNQSKRRGSQHSHKSFLALLGLAFGKQDFSVDQAIQKCEQFQITAKEQLLSLMDEKEPSREWPLPLSNLLLTDLGQLKVMKLCQSIQNQEDLSDHELQILQFLLPDASTENIQVLDRSAVLQSYNQFRTSIHEKCSYGDTLVKTFTLQIHPKIRKVKDKVALIKMGKQLKRCQRANNGLISYGQLKTCLQIFQLTEEETLLTFKYLYFVQNQKIVNLVDRKSMISSSTCFKELLDKEDRPIVKHTISTLQTYEEENSMVINDLLNDKNYLLETIFHRDTEIESLRNQMSLLQLQLRSREKQCIQQKERQISNIKARYKSQLWSLEQENKGKDKLIRWYKNELQAIVDQNKREFIASNRHKVYYKVFKSTEVKDTDSKESSSQSAGSGSCGEDSDR